MNRKAKSSEDFEIRTKRDPFGGPNLYVFRSRTSYSLTEVKRWQNEWLRHNSRRNSDMAKRPIPKRRPQPRRLQSTNEKLNEREQKVFDSVLRHSSLQYVPARAKRTPVSLLHSKADNRALKNVIKRIEADNIALRQKSPLISSGGSPKHRSEDDVSGSNKVENSIEKPLSMPTPVHIRVNDLEFGKLMQTPFPTPGILRPQDLAPPTAMKQSPVHVKFALKSQPQQQHYQQQHQQHQRKQPRPLDIDDENDKRYNELQKKYGNNENGKLKQENGEEQQKQQQWALPENSYKNENTDGENGIDNIKHTQMDEESKHRNSITHSNPSMNGTPNNNNNNNSDNSDPLAHNVGSPFTPLINHYNDVTPDSSRVRPSLRSLEKQHLSSPLASIGRIQKDRLLTVNSSPSQQTPMRQLQLGSSPLKTVGTIEPEEPTTPSDMHSINQPHSQLRPRKSSLDDLVDQQAGLVAQLASASSLPSEMSEIGMKMLDEMTRIRETNERLVEALEKSLMSSSASLSGVSNNKTINSITGGNHQNSPSIGRRTFNHTTFTNAPSVISQNPIQTNTSRFDNSYFPQSTTIPEQNEISMRFGNQIFEENGAISLASNAGRLEAESSRSMDSKAISKTNNNNNETKKDINEDNNDNSRNKITLANNNQQNTTINEPTASRSHYEEVLDRFHNKGVRSQLKNSRMGATTTTITASPTPSKRTKILSEDTKTNNTKINENDDNKSGSINNKINVNNGDNHKNSENKSTINNNIVDSNIDNNNNGDSNVIINNNNNNINGGKKINNNNTNEEYEKMQSDQKIDSNSLAKTVIKKSHDSNNEALHKFQSIRPYSKARPRFHAVDPNFAMTHRKRLRELRERELIAIDLMQKSTTFPMGRFKNGNGNGSGNLKVEVQNPKENNNNSDIEDMNNHLYFPKQNAQQPNVFPSPLTKNPSPIALGNTPTPVKIVTNNIVPLATTPVLGIKSDQSNTPKTAKLSTAPIIGGKLEFDGHAIELDENERVMTNNRIETNLNETFDEFDNEVLLQEELDLLKKTIRHKEDQHSVTVDVLKKSHHVEMQELKIEMLKERAKREMSYEAEKDALQSQLQSSLQEQLEKALIEQQNHFQLQVEEERKLHSSAMENQRVLFQQQLLQLQDMFVERQAMLSNDGDIMSEPGSTVVDISIHEDEDEERTENENDSENDQLDETVVKENGDNDDDDEEYEMLSVQ